MADILGGVDGVWRWRRAQAISLAQASADRARIELRQPIRISPGGRALGAVFALGSGAAAYITAPFEPSAFLVWSAAIIALAAALAVGVTSGVTRTASILAMTALVALGAGWTQARTAATPDPPAALGARLAETTSVTGWVERIDASGRAARYTLRVVAAGDHQDPSGRWRVRVRGAMGAATLGQAVVAPVRLTPIEAALTPGGYDPERAAFFSRRAADGWLTGAPQPVDRDALSGRGRLDRAIARVRGVVSARIAEDGGARGGLIAALVTGDRSGITRADRDALRGAGLGHVLAISGLHMALVAGGAFVMFTRGLAWIPPLARRINVRKPAAVAALAAALGYLALSGASVSAQRAFIMAAVALCAVLLDRRALSLRTVAAAGLLVLTLRPESAVSAGFQMSFAATAALVAAYSAWRRARSAHARPRSGLTHAVSRFVGGLSLTSLVAGAATGPIAAFHFNRVAVYGFLANLVAMPVFTALVMPLTALAGVAALLNVEAPFALWAGTSMGLVIAIAQTVTGWTGAVREVAAGPGLALFLAGASITAFCTFSSGARRIGGGLALVAVWVWTVAPQPDAWFGPRGGVVIAADARVVMEASGADRYEARRAARRWGVADPEAPARCDGFACMAAVRGRPVLIARDLAGLEAGCPDGALVVLARTPPARARALCPNAVLISPRWDGRASVARLTPMGWRVETVNGAPRPWRMGSDQP